MKFLHRWAENATVTQIHTVSHTHTQLFFLTALSVINLGQFRSPRINT